MAENEKGRSLVRNKKSSERGIYLERGSSVSATLSKSSATKIWASVLLAIFFLFSSVISALPASNESKANAFDVGQFAFCDLFGSSVPGMREMYQITQSSDLQFFTRSKNSINYGTNDVDGGLNLVLSLSGKDFAKTNETILSHPLDSKSAAKNDENKGKDESKFNGGKQVTPFDRFGVSGLKYTSYIGEWRHVVVDACSTDNNVSDPKAGNYYEGRLYPLATWEDKDRFNDIRSMQFNSGISQHFLMSSVNELSNIIFFVTKSIVVLALALIGFSFQDIGSVLGINKIIYGDDGKEGLVQSLHEGFFLPLIAIFASLTAIYILFTIVTRKSSNGKALGRILRSIAMVIVALVIAAKPVGILSMPNDLSVAVQGVFVNALNKPISGNDSICSTNGAKTDSNLVKEDANKTLHERIGEVGKNVQSTIGCSIWQQFLFKPWAQGQFGTDWNNLWAEGKIPSWDKNGKTLGNKNSSWVGSPSVPMGNGIKYDNWALFQVSVQTNAHSPVGQDGKISKITDGISNDWWRIVDATSNYQEIGERNQEDLSGADGEDSSAVNTTSGTWVWPTNKKGDISSPYGNRGLADAGGSNFHRGIDFGAPCGDPIYAASDGVVKFAGKEAFGGNAILIQHKDVDSLYVHMSDGSNKVKVGDKVKAGQRISSVGQTGNAYGCHLHFEIRKPATGNWGDFNKTIDAGAFMKGAVNGEVSNSDSGSDSGSSDSSGGTVATLNKNFARPVGAAPTAVWNDWTGNSVVNRIGTSFSSILVAMIGLFGPIVFALMTAVYGLGLTILMVMAPIMFLLAAGPDMTFQIFKNWLKLLGSIFIKKVVMGIILSLSLVFTALALSKMETVGWWTGMLMLVTLSVVLWKLRGKLVDLLTRFTGMSDSSSNVFNRITSAIGNAATTTTKVAASTATGGYVSRRNGGTLSEGMKAGAKREIRNAAYRSDVGRSAIREYDVTEFNEEGKEIEGSDKEILCSNCYAVIYSPGMPSDSILASRDENGNYYCMTCFNDRLSAPNAKIVNLNSIQSSRRLSDSERKKHVQTSLFGVRFDKDFQDNVGAYDSSEPNPEIKKKNIERLQEQMNRSMLTVAADVVRSQDVMKEHGFNGVVEIPAHLKRYLNEDVVKKAWQEGNYNYIVNAYVIAQSSWFKDKTGLAPEKDTENLVSDVWTRVNKRESTDGTQG